MRRLIVLFLFLPAIMIPAETLTERFESFQGSFYRGTMEPLELQNVIDDLSSEGSESSELIAAGLMLLLGDYRLDSSRSLEDPEALRLYREAKAIAEGVELEDPLRYSILIDAKIRSLIGRGAAAFISEGASISSLMNTAIKRYPKDARIQYQYAMSKINAPRLFGGDFKKGERIAKNLLKSRNSSEVIRFIVSQGMASVYLRREDEKQSREYWKQALEIYPETWVTLREMDQ